MGQLTVPLPSRAIAKHLEYAAWFADERLQRVSVDGDQLTLAFADGVDEQALRTKIERLAARFAQMGDFNAKEQFSTGGGLAEVPEVFPELVARGWVVELGKGQVTLRGLALELLEFFDDALTRALGSPVHARRESYPSVMSTERMNRSNHFGSFPEHVHFVTHLREDLDLLDDFARELRAAGGWTPEVLGKLSRPFASPVVALNPSVCYNCYASLENTVLEGEGFVATARSRCHRYESGNHRTLARLMDFQMREVIFVGQPDFVKKQRAAAVERLQHTVARWGLASRMETANDPFFTNDFEVKAAFQRNNEMKHELRMAVAGGSVAVASSNFHSTTFGKAFNITQPNTRPVCTGCVGFGLERWIYSAFSQLGLDPAKWPAALAADFAAFQERDRL